MEQGSGADAVVSDRGGGDAGRLVDRGFGGEMLVWTPALAAVAFATALVLLARRV